MPIAIAAITVLLQAIFIIHVFRTNRPIYWAFIILSAPIIGFIAYYLIEVMPGSREHRNASRAVQRVIKSFNPTAELQRRLADLDVNPSAQTKIAAADEYVRCGGLEQAIELYESALSGVHANDADLIYKLAHTHVENGTLQSAEPLLQKLRTDHAKYRSAEVAVLTARVLEAKGDQAGAAALYEAALPKYVGLEAQYRYGRLLRNMGQETQARTVFQELIAHAQRHNVSLDSEEQWLRAAQRELNEA